MKFCPECGTNLFRIKEQLERCKKSKNDFVIISTNSHCPICKNYNRKIYSISGKTKKHPKLPTEIKQLGGFCPKCYLGLGIYFEGINSKP